MMLKKLALATALAVSGVGAVACEEPPGNCQEAASSLSPELTERIDQLVTERMQQGHVPGLSLVVLRDGQPAYVRGYGSRENESGEPMTACSRVSIGSTTKSMTALAMMQLVEREQVDLEAPVTRYLPWLQTADGQGGDILVKHVLSHTAGLPTSSLLEGDMDDGALERRVRAAIQPAPMLVARAQYASGAATYASAHDVSEYLTALLAKGRLGQTQVLRPESVDRMWQPLASTGDSSYGLGWYVGQLYGRRAIFHSGSVVGSGSMFVLFPDDNVAVGTLANLNSHTQEEVARSVAALLMGAEPPPATPPFYRAPSTFVPDRSVWQQYLGDYQVYSLGRVRLREESGRLMGDLFYTEPTLVVELEAYGDNDFVTRSPLGLTEGLSVSFQSTADGGMLLLVDGQPLGQKL